MRRKALVGAVIAAIGGGAPAAARAATTLTPVPGSPFATVGSPPGAGDQPVAVAFNPGSSLLVTANGDGSVSEFSVATDGALTQLPGAEIAPGTSGLDVAWSPTRRLVAVSFEQPGSGGIDIFTRAPGSAQLTLSQTIGTSNPSSSIAFSPNGRYFATVEGLVDGPGGPGAFSLFRVSANGTLVNAGGEYLAANPQVVAFSPDGAQLAVGGGQSSDVNVYSVPALTPIGGSPFPVGAKVTCLAYRPSGGLLAGCGPRTITLATVSASGALTRQSPIYGHGAYDLAWNPSGSLLAASNSHASDSVYSVTGHSATPVDGSPFAVSGTAGGLQFSPDGRFLATAGDTLSGAGSSSVTMDAATTPGG